ncbi:MAG TPA: hypothetical protein VL463_30905 [Kofleriaceae bacterium]|nr:hypothetical protein [Kofleriaceae bacterium]
MAALVVVGCYKTPKPNCTFSCGEGGACPTDYTCGPDKICHLMQGGGLAPCEQSFVDGAVIDAFVPTFDSSVDASVIDAKPADARPVDAKPADARPVDARPADARPADARPPDASVDASPPDASVDANLPDAS